LEALLSPEIWIAFLTLLVLEIVLGIDNVIFISIIADKLLKGEFHEIKAIMQKSQELGMRTFDTSLFELYNEGHISYDEAIKNADSANELRLNIKLKGRPQQTTGLSLEPEKPESPEEESAAA